MFYCTYLKYLGNVYNIICIVKYYTYNKNMGIY